MLVAQAMGASKGISVFGSLTVVCEWSGAILDATGSFVGPFLMSGSMMLAGGLLGLPARRIARWELRRNDSRKDQPVDL